MRNKIGIALIAAAIVLPILYGLPYLENKGGSGIGDDRDIVSAGNHSLQDSIIRYELCSELTELVSVDTIDSLLVPALTGEGYLNSVTAPGSVAACDTGVITFDLENGDMIFELHFSDQNIPAATCVKSSNGEYTVNVVPRNDETDEVDNTQEPEKYE